MPTKKDLIWPYSKKAAIMAIPFIWMLFAIFFSLTHRFANWPGSESRNLVVIGSIIISFVPLVLLLLDFFSSRGATIETKWGKIDFSKVDLSRQDVRRESFKLPDNIGMPGEKVADSHAMNIVSALKSASDKNIVQIDLKSGKAWWLTRLLALSAGAVRAGSPEVLVFVGTKSKKENYFIGWVDPKDALNAIFIYQADYVPTYHDAMRIAKQVVTFGAGNNKMFPEPANTFEFDSKVQRYTEPASNPYADKYDKMGDAVLEQILMDQLSQFHEASPVRLSINRVQEIFSHCLFENLIDLSWPYEKQLAHILESQTSYIALVQNGIYDSMLKREDGERLIIRELFLQSQQKEE